ncbi:MAG TPA: C25 family cysteine peptidase [Thermoanaerobaculia bacterium]|nr:C25 family cysteine peptidase [Thermoanaerobaculia bacterium]
MSVRALVVGCLCLAAAFPAAAQTLFVSDSFTESSNQLLESHTPEIGGAWTREVGGSGLVVVASADFITPNLNNDYNRYTNAAVPPATEYSIGVAFEVTNPSVNNLVDLVGRWDPATSTGYLARVQGNGTVTLALFVNGVATVLSTSTGTVTTNTAHLLVFTIEDDLKAVYVDGVLRASSTDNTVTAANFVGVAMNRNGSLQIAADDFFAGTFSPTAVDSLDATALRDGKRVLLSWETTGEVDNAGFRVHRETRGQRELLTPHLIAGSAFLAGRASLAAGNSYQWMDERAPLVARYWIEELDLHGKRTWHGPFVPKRGAFDARRSVSRTIAELTSGGQTILSVRPLSMDSQDWLSSTARVDLAGSRATKLHVAAPGWYRVPLDASADAKKVALFTEGVEVATRVENGALSFYGVPIDTQWTGERVYWLAERPSKAKRIERVASANATIEQTSYRTTIERRDKVFFFPALVNDDGDGFLGPVVSTDPASPTIQTLTLTAIAPEDARLAVTLQGGTDLPDKQHRVRVSVNGNAIGECAFTGQQRTTCTMNVPAALLRDGANEIGYAAVNGFDDISAVIALQLTYSRGYRADHDRLQFTLEGGRFARLAGFTRGDLLVLDITDPANVAEVPLRADGSVAAKGIGTRVLFALPRTAFDTVARAEANEPSSLLATREADVVILTHPKFASAVEPLRQLRVSQGLSVLVATTTDVYDELNSGHKDPAAIRAFLAASRKWRTPPRYVVLAGDASFDSRNYLGAGDFDFVPTRLVATQWLRTASDAWFTDFDGDLVSEIAIGRLPARTRDEAAAMVRKIVAYETLPALDSWSRRALFVSDADPQFAGQTRAVAATLPARMIAEHIDVAASGAAAARARLLGELDQGALVTAFVGHGSIEIWTAQRILTRADALQLTNGHRLPLVLAMTCLNGYFHDLFTDSLAEALMRSENGGAIAVWASSALSDPVAQASAGRAFLQTALTAPRIGDAFIAAQRSAAMAEIRTTFVLFGDPATRLKR